MHNVFYNMLEFEQHDSLNYLEILSAYVQVDERFPKEERKILGILEVVQASNSLPALRGIVLMCQDHMI